MKGNGLGQIGCAIRAWLGELEENLETRGMTLGLCNLIALDSTPTCIGFACCWDVDMRHAVSYACVYQLSAAVTVTF